MTFLATQIAEMERRYGLPDLLTFMAPTSAVEFNRIARSMHSGRAHDITLFIAKDDGYIFIAKPFYPPGLFRAPSGGAHVGEDFETGAKREALEETGVEIALERYILRIEAKFASLAGAIDWTTHIFTARYISGKIDPQDKREISAARLVHLDEVSNFREIMLRDGRAGFKYRAFLTDESIKRL